MFFFPVHADYFTLRCIISSTTRGQCYHNAITAGRITIILHYSKLRKQQIHTAMIWEAHAPSIRWNLNIINVAFVLFLITTCSLALITKSFFFAVGVPVEAHHKRKMRWNQEKPHKNEHQIVSKYIYCPHFCAQKTSVDGTHKSCSKANIPLSYLWEWNKYFESEHI